MKNTINNMIAKVVEGSRNSNESFDRIHVNIEEMNRITGEMTLSMTEQVISFRRNESQIALVKNRSLRLEQISCKLSNQDLTYLDVREPYEEPRPLHKQLLNIPLNQLPDRYEEIPRNTEIYVFCQSGIRSKKAIALLKKEYGFTNLVDVEGGIKSIIK